MEEKTVKNIITVSVCERSAELDECNRSLDELDRLIETAGGASVARVIQVKDSFDPRTVIGRGKVLEIKELAQKLSASLAVFDMELSPIQIRNLEDDMEIEVIDRSMLILDIFAMNATTAEGKLQVELAQLKYTAPRLIGKGIELSRQGGGIGSRGPGETKLETDRRHLRSKIAILEEKLRELEHNREIMRGKRDRSGITKIAVVGYTNAGKSTLLNRLTDAGVLAEDKLFATLDPTTRKFELPSGVPVLLTDTVGFIRKLPHHLIKAFKSTLDEVRYADILMIVSDINDPEVKEHLAVTEELIRDLSADGKPKIYVYNKCDMLEGVSYAVPREDTVLISARENTGIDALLEALDRTVNDGKRECALNIPYNRQSELSAIYNDASVISVDYTDTGISVRAVLDKKLRGRYKDFIVGENE